AARRVFWPRLVVVCLLSKFPHLWQHRPEVEQRSVSGFCPVCCNNSGYTHRQLGSSENWNASTRKKFWIRISVLRLRPRHRRAICAGSTGGSAGGARRGGWGRESPHPRGKNDCQGSKSRPDLEKSRAWLP